MEIIRLLWIEDETDTGLVERKTWLELCDDIDLTIARNATEGHRQLQNAEGYDVIIVDIRLPPGVDERYQQMHYNGNERLGIVLVQEAAKHDATIIAKTGLFTVEREADLKALVKQQDIPWSAFMHKGEADTTEKFEAYIRRIYKKRN
jgi:CheY-like chemotaxis protein